MINGMIDWFVFSLYRISKYVVCILYDTMYGHLCLNCKIIYVQRGCVCKSVCIDEII